MHIKQLCKTCRYIYLTKIVFYKNIFYLIYNSCIFAHKQCQKQMSFIKPNIIKFDLLTSTNDKMSELIKKDNLPEFSIVTTENQSIGKGQMGNSWESEPGKNLTFSIFCKPNFIPINEQFKITQIITLSIINSLKPILKNISIKWPNDIYCGDKKIAGILVENSLKGSKIDDSIIGVGLNVNQTEFHSDAPNPSSLKLLTNKEHNLDELLNKILFNFIDIYLDLLHNDNSKSMQKKYMSNLYRSDGLYKYSDDKGDFYAKIVDIMSTGHLVLETESGEIRKYAFKEVSFIV